MFPKSVPIGLIVVRSLHLELNGLKYRVALPKTTVTITLPEMGKNSDLHLCHNKDTPGSAKLKNTEV